MRIALAALLVSLCASTGLAQGSALSLETTPAGVLRAVRVGDAVVACDLSVSIVSPDWSRTIAHQEALIAGAATAPEGEGGLAVEGVLPAEEGAIEFRLRAEPSAEGVRLTYRIRATAPIPSAMVVLRANLPTSSAGGVWWMHEDGDLRSDTLPAALPEPYVLANGRPGWVAWRLPEGDSGLRFDLPAGLYTAQLQDNRQFGVDRFELQLPLAGVRELDPATPLAFDLLLRPFTAAQAEEATAEARARVERETVVFAAQAPLALRGVAVEPAEAVQYEPVTLRLDLDATYDNPFDPEDIDVSARFRGPGGAAWTVPGLWCVPYERLADDGRERLRKTGPGEWLVRFSPMATGRHECVVSVRDRSGTVRSRPLSFDVAPGDGRGFIRRSERSPYYLRYDSGEPYFAVGENVCWGGDAQTVDYDTWFAKLGRAGGNYARIWLVRWNMGLEWSASDPSARGRFYGLGLYSPDNAARLDYLLALAGREGIALMLCLGYHGELLDTKAFFGEQCWDRSPYNAANGGPCATPDEFWTDPRARALYKRKLRYTIARWGWSPNALSFEFWNEVNAPAPWIAEMADYVRSIDPYRHLLTTTYGDDQVWALPTMDYSQTHFYGSGDLADCTEAVAGQARRYTTQFGKPYLLGEFGIDWRSSDSAYDPEGKATNLHNGLWAAMASRSMGGAMVWYWDGYVEPKGLYREFAALARFASDVPWADLDARLADTTAPALPERAGAPWGSATIVPGMGWGRSTGTDFTLDPSGAVVGEGTFSSTLFSSGKPEYRMPLRFTVSCPEGGRLALHVGRVSSGALLRVTVDGALAWGKTLTAGPPGEGEYKSSEYQPDWDGWYSTYDEDYTVDLPPGHHTVEVDNAGGDWVEVSSYRFEGCVDPRFATGLDVYGIATDDFAILWLHNESSNWKTDAAGQEPEPTPETVSFALRGLREGSYRIEWFDTRTGEPVRAETAIATGGALHIRPGRVARDVACKVRREG